MTKQNNLITGCLCALGCETIFGLSYMFTKNATESAIPPLRKGSFSGLYPGGFHHCRCIAAEGIFYHISDCGRVGDHCRSLYGKRRKHQLVKPENMTAKRS